MRTFPWGQWWAYPNVKHNKKLLEGWEIKSPKKQLPNLTGLLKGLSLSPKAGTRKNLDTTALQSPFLPWEEPQYCESKELRLSQDRLRTWLSIHLSWALRPRRAWAGLPRTEALCASPGHSQPPQHTARLHAAAWAASRSKASVAGWLNSLLLKHLTEKNLHRDNRSRKKKRNEPISELLQNKNERHLLQYPRSSIKWSPLTQTT